VRPGSAFDVVGGAGGWTSRRQQRRWIEEIEVELRNTGQAVEVQVRESLFRWSAGASSAEMPALREEDPYDRHR
jgi:hypothetical protein